MQINLFCLCRNLHAAASMADGLPPKLGWDWEGWDSTPTRAGPPSLPPERTHAHTHARTHARTHTRAHAHTRTHALALQADS
jgi:hypothetical protein